MTIYFCFAIWICSHQQYSLSSSMVGGHRCFTFSCLIDLVNILQISYTLYRTSGGVTILPLKTTTESFRPSPPALNNNTNALLCIFVLLKMNLSLIFCYGELSTAENWDTMIFLQRTLGYNCRGSTNHDVRSNMLAKFVFGVSTKGVEWQRK